MFVVAVVDTFVHVARHIASIAQRLSWLAPCEGVVLKRRGQRSREDRVHAPYM